MAKVKRRITKAIQSFSDWWYENVEVRNAKVKMYSTREWRIGRMCWDAAMGELRRHLKAKGK